MSKPQLPPDPADVRSFFVDFYAYASKGFKSLSDYFIDTRKWDGRIEHHKLSFLEFSKEPDNIVYTSAFYWYGRDGSKTHVLDLTPEEVRKRVAWFEYRMRNTLLEMRRTTMRYMATQLGPQVRADFAPAVTYPLLYWAMSVEVQAHLEHGRLKREEAHEIELAEIAHAK
jgi:hypothetical protein